MSYGRDYGNRNFLERAANTVRGWVGRGPQGGGYDDGYRGGMDRGWNEGRGGYREMGDVSGYRGAGWNGGMEHGYGAAGWRGYNDDWNRGAGGGARAGWGHAGGEGYRTGGYQPRHGAWDVEWDEDRTMPGGGMGRGMQAGMGGGYGGGYDSRDYYAGRDFMTNQGSYDYHDAYRDDMEPGGRGNMGRMSGGMMGAGGMNRGVQGGMGRGMQGGMDRDWDRGQWGQGGRGDWNRSGGMSRGGTGAQGGMLGGDADLGDAGGGMIGNYGAYGSYGIERFRSGSAGGVPTGQYWTGYGHGSGYRG